MTTETQQPEQTTDQVQELNPQQGGSFLRQPDGSLVPATQPDSLE